MREKKTKTLNLFTTQTEFSRVKNLADASNITVSEFVRLVLAKVTKPLEITVN